MTNLVSSWREELARDLAAQFDAEIVNGMRTGTSRDLNRIAVFWPGVREVPGRVVVSEPRLTVRYWPKNPKLRTGSPQDPTELEEAGYALMEFLQTKQTAYTETAGVWFFRVQSVTPDYDPDEWGVEAILVANANNVAVI